MMGSFAFPFATAESTYAGLSSGLNDAADAELLMPEDFQGATADALEAAQMQRRATLIGLADAAHRAAGYAGTQNAADEALAQAPSPAEVEMARQVTLSMIAGLKTGQVTATEAMLAQREYGELLAERQLAVTVHAGESERTAGCFGGLYLPEVQARRGGGAGDVPLEEGAAAADDGQILPKRTDGGGGAGDPATTAPEGVTPLPEILSPPAMDSLPGIGSGGGMTAEFPDHGGMVSEFPGPPLPPLNPETGLASGGFPLTPQMPSLSPMPLSPQQGGMPGGGFAPMPMPGLPMPGGSFTAPPGGRMLDPTPPRRNPLRDGDDREPTTADDLDLTLFPDGGAAAVTGGVVAGGMVGSSVTGVTTPANTTGVTAPVVSALPPMNPSTGAVGPATGAMVPPMGAMGSGVGATGGGARTVSADQLTGLAVALRVSPVGLLMPYSSTGDLDEECSLTGVEHELSTFVLSWLLADEPFTDDRSGSDEARAVRTTFRRRSLPPWAWRTEK